MEEDIFMLPSPEGLVKNKVYYLVKQKARYTCWVYLGMGATGEWFKNRGTGADFFVTIDQVREVPATDYRYMKIPEGGLLSDEEVSNIRFISEYNKKRSANVSQRSIEQGLITYEAMQEELYGTVTDTVVAPTYYKAQPSFGETPTNTQGTTHKETPGVEVVGWEQPLFSLDEAKQILASMPSMSEKIYVMYPELKPNIPVIWDIITADGYTYNSNDLTPTKAVSCGNVTPRDLEDNVVGIPEYLRNMNAVRKMSFLQQHLPVLEVDKDAPLYTFVVSTESGGVDIIPTTDIANVFIFQDEDTAKTFLANNTDIVEEYFSFINKIFKQL